MKDMLEVIQNQDDVGEAITSAANITRQEMEGLIHGISATEKGINYYASNLSGFKAEIRNHCQNLKKTLDGSWEWCQIAVWLLCGLLFRSGRSSRRSQFRDGDRV
jgi:hypothetical protein